VCCSQAADKPTRDMLAHLVFNDLAGCNIDLLARFKVLRGLQPLPFQRAE
jgi:hypothetical protein